MTRPRWVLLAAATAVVLVAGCTSGTVSPSGSPTPTPTPTPALTPAPISSSAPSISPPTSSPSVPVNPPPSSPSHPASSPPRSSISPTPTTPAPTTSAPTSSAPTTPPTLQSTCTSLMIRVLQGSGAPGYELDALDFVNTGRTACVLIGVPSVTLFKNGEQVGTTSRPASAAAAVSRYQLKPGAVGESRLKDFSTCQAPLSDEIKAVVPGSTISTTRPGELRACTLRAYPLTAPE